MDKLSKDEIFLIATKLDIYSLLNFSMINSNIYSKVSKDEIWEYKLREFNNYLNLKEKKKDTYILLYRLTIFKKKLEIEENIYKIFKCITYGFNVTEIPREIGILINLQGLYLPFNKIHKVPKEIGNLIHLQELRLDNNNIKTIPKEIGNLLNLRKLLLNNNCIKIIPKEIGKLTKLEGLNLSYNDIEKLPKEIGNLIELSCLNLRNNMIEKLPIDLLKISNLLELNITQNRIKSIPKWIKSFQYLRSIIN